MKAQKITVNITVEVLDIDVVGGMVVDALANIQNQAETGSLEMSDGDTVRWETERENLEF